MKEVKPAEQLNRGKLLVEVGLFLLIFNGLTAVYGWQMIANHFHIVGEGLLVEKAWIQDGLSPVFDPRSVDSYYIFLIRLLFLFFGNNRALVPVANTVLQILGVFFFYRGGRRLINEKAGILIAFLASIVSIWCFTPNLDDSSHLLWFSGGLLFWLFSFFKVLLRGIKTRTDNAEVVKPDEEKKEEPSANFIPNPLPLPKKHIKKEMNYAFEPPKELMHYDFNNYRAEDDYDLKES